MEGFSMHVSAAPYQTTQAKVLGSRLETVYVRGGTHYIRSAECRHLTAKALRLVRRTDRQDARTMRDTLTVAASLALLG